MKSFLLMLSVLLTAVPAKASVPKWISNIAADDNQENTCMSLAIYYEAKGEPEAGQRAVGHVMKNRVKNARYPSTVCGVLLQRGQFSFIGKGLRAPSGPLWTKAKQMTAKVIAEDDDPSHGALSFHNVKRGRHGVVIGHHAFV